MTEVITTGGLASWLFTALVALGAALLLVLVVAAIVQIFRTSFASELIGFGWLVVVIVVPVVGAVAWFVVGRKTATWQGSRAKAAANL